MNTDLQKIQTMAQHLQMISDAVALSHIKREGIIKGSWLSIVSGRPLFIKGKPGVDKTATVKAMMNSVQGAAFRDELMPILATGAQLIVEGTVLRETPLPDGSKEISTIDRLGGVANMDLFFADEIWKTDDHVLKVLFDLFNLDDVRYDGQIAENNLMTFMAASNELPDPESKLYALWSRMTIRMTVDSLDRTGKKALFAARRKRDQGLISPPPQTSVGVLRALRKMRPFVNVSGGIEDEVLDILEELTANTTSDFQWLWDDDRRVGRSIDVMQANALLNGRDTVNKGDLSVLEWMYWDTEEQIPIAQATIRPHCRTPLMDAQEELDVLMASGGTVDIVLKGNRAKGVDALTQCEKVEKELNRLVAEATDPAMRADIAKLVQEASQTKQALIAIITGAKKP